MKGIVCAFTAKCGQDAELKTSKSGKPWASFSVAADDDGEREATTWVRVVMFGEWATELHPELKKGAEVYCEGRLRLEFWTGRDGRERSDLSVTVAKLVVLGQIGFDPTSRKSEEARGAQPELEGHGRADDDGLPF
jgi:single-strand DNA-binding protein